ncbi:MAG: alkylmercury lyase family protein [Thermoplasmata archaeon]|nr:alkylmercury lyase family protein [Thermoplasmata archaeon]
MPPADVAAVRKFVFDYFLEHSVPPVAELIAVQFGLNLPAVRHALEQLDAAHHLRLLPGTSRVLMAFPFSAVATPFRVTRAEGHSYFANCAWDAVAFRPMLREPIRIDSYCAHCNAPLTFVLDGEPSQPPGIDGPLVYLGRPAHEWWDDIISTCSNTMLFLRSGEHLADWQAETEQATGQVLSIERTVQLSEPIYQGKFDLGYSRLSKEELQSHFARLGLIGPFWKL